MRLDTKSVTITSRATLLGVSLAALSASAFAAEYKMTVNKDRLINSANEPQNWLMMNGDYGSTRYSKLAQINRDNVKNLRMVWPLGSGRGSPPGCGGSACWSDCPRTIQAQNYGLQYFGSGSTAQSGG
jgi:alcohol dehydrogenase (cytochrome c)